MYIHRPKLRVHFDGKLLELKWYQGIKLNNVREKQKTFLKSQSPRKSFTFKIGGRVIHFTMDLLPAVSSIKAKRHARTVQRGGSRIVLMIKCTRNIVSFSKEVQKAIKRRHLFECENIEVTEVTNIEGTKVRQFKVSLKIDSSHFRLDNGKFIICTTKGLLKSTDNFTPLEMPKNQKLF